jgi:hypothetical protein
MNIRIYPCLATLHRFYGYKIDTCLEGEINRYGFSDTYSFLIFDLPPNQSIIQAFQELNKCQDIETTIKLSSLGMVHKSVYSSAIHIYNIQITLRRNHNNVLSIRGYTHDSDYLDSVNTLM